MLLLSFLRNHNHCWVRGKICLSSSDLKHGLILSFKEFSLDGVPCLLDKTRSLSHRQSFPLGFALKMVSEWKRMILALNASWINVSTTVLGSMFCPSSCLQGDALCPPACCMPHRHWQQSLRLVTSHLTSLGLGGSPNGAACLIQFQLSTCGYCGHSEAWSWLLGCPHSGSWLCSPLSETISHQDSNPSGILHGPILSTFLGKPPFGWPSAFAITSSFRGVHSRKLYLGEHIVHVWYFPETNTEEWNCGIIGYICFYILRWSHIYLQSHCFQFIFYFPIPMLILKMITLYKLTNLMVVK